MKITIDVNSTVESMCEAIESNMSAQERAILKEENKNDKLRLIGTLNILRKLLIEVLSVRN